MDLRDKSKPRFMVWTFLGAGVGLLLFSAIGSRPAELTATEDRCVGSWSFSRPDNPTTLIVYHFAADRGVKVEHYYLSSATPHIPRITKVGQWRVESDGRLVIEANGGLRFAVDAASEFLGEYFDDGQRGWARPALTRFYRIDSATRGGLECRASRSGGPGEVRFTMEPFTGARIASRVPARS